MSLSIFEFGDGHFSLFRDGCEVGWVEGRAIGFLGFDTQAGAYQAATIAYDALSGWLARQSREQPAPRGRLELRLENGEHHLTIGGIAIGRLLSGPEDRIPNGGSRGFELRLPPRIGAALSAAQVIDQALIRHQNLPALETTNTIGTPEAVA
jgi:hypothetical protein